MRIITGDLRGRALLPIKERGIRPTSSKTREALFNIIGSVQGFKVLDLYAGTGSIGFEAISRGASSATMVDISSKLLQAIKETAEKWKISEKIICQRNDVLRFAAQTLQSPEKYDLIFADPPFNEEYPDLRIFLPKLNKGGYAVFETQTRNMPAWASEALKTRSYGESSLIVFVINHF
ncbi:MAG: RsmD family RNA methyltransferase [Fibromonadaceae bacterium]|jgi:16S rRNA (guanine966-N2)-methyltransferase|nr:RsmD family RNA methyltransferase [Fibromonadaceae bacterium]